MTLPPRPQGIPAARVRADNCAPPRPEARFVLYWMTAARRPGWNFAFQAAVGWARELGKPLLVLEPLRCDYPWASDRIHRFLLEGMADNGRAFRSLPVRYYPYLEMSPGQGKGLLGALAGDACVVVADHFPAFFLPRMVAAAAASIPVRLESVDGCGLLPLAEAPAPFPTAFSFRKCLQRRLPYHLGEMPEENPARDLPSPPPDLVPRLVLQRWPEVEPHLLEVPADVPARLPIDHSVPPAPARGGFLAAERALGSFLDRKLRGYAERRNEPSQEGTSGLAPYLHFGHISPHRIFAALSGLEGWGPDRLGIRADGKRTGWWGMGQDSEAFLDQLVTWRELGYAFCRGRADYDRLESLPAWARATLEKHSADLRPHLYGREALEAAQTHDPLWNAAQRQLLREGRIHNYLRMLWGKKVLEWSPSPREALETLVHLNNKYALDGRDPNSYTGILWVLGRHDRPWGPERAVYGTVRYMSSENTARKYDVKDYLARYG